jgi:cytochrome c552
VHALVQTCHHFPEEELKARVEDIQDRFFNLRNTALDALVDLINDIKTAKQNGTTDAQLAAARDYSPSRTVHDRLRDVGELYGLPRAAGSPAHFARRH